MARRDLIRGELCATLALLVGLCPAAAFAEKSEQNSTVASKVKSEKPASTSSSKPEGKAAAPVSASGGSKAPTPNKSSAKSNSGSPVSHKIGKAPAVPQSSLPVGAPRPEPDEVAREQVAGGPTQEKMERGLEDPELRALRDAEQVLFPRTLPGLESGWSWGLPEPTQPGTGLSASGVPAGMDDAAPPLADEPIPADKEWLRSLALPNLPVKLGARVVRYLKFYRDTPRGLAIARIWAAKVGRYMPAMMAVFARAGLPTDLVYLSLIESGQNPTIFSPAGAAGLWQFMPESGRMYGLTVDRWVDERLDPQRSTEAAARYLRDLQQRFGSWDLAMAAYNMGQTGLLRAMRQYNTNNFWRLSEYEAALPWETTLYVPKIQAIAIVMNNRKAFGLDDVERDQPVSFDTVFVSGQTALQDVAGAAGVPVESLRALNPQYLADRTPPNIRRGERSRYSVYVPLGLGAQTTDALAKKETPAGSTVGQTTSALVRLGDSLESVAYRFRTTPEVVRRMNQIRADEQLQDGSVLLVPALEAGADPAEDREDYVVVPHQAYAFPGRDRVFYKVCNNDSLNEIAHAFSVTPGELVRWNGLDADATLQADMTLQLFVPQHTDLSRVRYIKPNNTQMLLTGSVEFIEFFEGQKGRNRVVVGAKPGDTLSKIGSRYGMSVSMMERINRFPRDKQLRSGEPVVVYTKRSVPQAELSVEAQSVLPPVEPSQQESQASLDAAVTPRN
ncbi:MAG TPA: LysM peptidoglycan-binding domain-containing protein [Polyangiaceae bacterium]|nr:LysM peptidoglycan-binding domain-containing protein [Polyangiaceae bacterium]